jgi:hypothetical protein
LEKSNGVVTVRDFLLRKLIVQENTLDRLSRKENNSKETIDYRERQE